MGILYERRFHQRKSFIDGDFLFYCHVLLQPNKLCQAPVRRANQQHRRAHDDRANPKSPTRTCAEAIGGARAIGGLSMEHPPIQTYYRHTISYWYIYIYNMTVSLII